MHKDFQLQQICPYTCIHFVQVHAGFVHFCAVVLNALASINWHVSVTLGFN